MFRIVGYLSDGYFTVNNPPKFKIACLKKRVEMATRKQLEKSYSKSVNNSTFDASSIDSTTVGEKLFRPTENEEENGDDGPVVFICAKCKLPVGDSLSWDGSEDDLNQIRLKRKFGLEDCLPF